MHKVRNRAVSPSFHNTLHLAECQLTSRKFNCSTFNDTLCELNSSVKKEDKKEINMANNSVCSSQSAVNDAQQDYSG